MVVFNNRAKRDAVHGTKQNEDGIWRTGLCCEATGLPNEHLCPKMKKLLGMAIAKKPEMSWRFAWAKGGKVYSRKTEAPRVIRTDSEDDIERIYNGANTP